MGTSRFARSRAAAAVSGAVVLITTLVAIGVGPAHAVSLADVGVAVESSPPAVSPPGGGVVYTIVVTNHGPAPAPGIDLTDTTVGGRFAAALSVIPAGCTAPADGTVDPTITCDFGLTAVGQQRTVKVGIETPPAVGEVTNTATVAVQPGLLGSVVDGNPANDTASATTAVTSVPDNDTQTQCGVAEGETCTFESGTTRAVLTVKTGRVIATLGIATGGGDECGDSACGDGVHVDFDTDPDYQGTVELDLTFGKGDPCRGVAVPSGCVDLYERKEGSITLIPFCSETEDESTTCIERTYKNKGNGHWVLHMTSEDPDLLPPIKLL